MSAGTQRQPRPRATAGYPCARGAICPTCGVTTQPAAPILDLDRMAQAGASMSQAITAAVRRF